MSCKICSTFSQKQLDKIREQYGEDSSAEQLAVKFSAPFDDMVFHCSNCLQDGEDGKRANAIKEILKDLRELMNQVKTSYEDNNDRADMIHAFTDLAREARSILESDADDKTPEERVREVLKAALNPILQKSISNLSNELSKLRSTLVTNGIKPDLVDSITKQAMLGFGANMKIAVVEAIERLCKQYGMKKQDISKVLVNYEPNAAASTQTSRDVKVNLPS